MSLFDSLKKLIRGPEPTMIDFDTPPADPAHPLRPTGTDDAPALLRQLRTTNPQTGNYKMQQSYDSLLDTVQQLRSSLDGQARRQEELLSRLATLPHAVETLPQTSKMQSDMLKVINDRLAMHVEQQRKVSDVMNSLDDSKKEHDDALKSIRDQIEMGNEIDRQLVESFNRFSMMIDRLHLANNHAVDALQQVRDSYATSSMQMQEWIEKSRTRNTWLIGGAFALSVLALVAVVILIFALMQPAR